MSAAEVATRVSQEARKRLDLARFRFGHDLQPRAVPGRPSKPDFPFRSDEIPSRVALLHEKLRCEAELIIHEADEIWQRRFRLLGYENLDFGSPIGWHLDPVHGKRAPLKPWFRINFLDFNEVGDHKVIWELNRHQHLITLAKAWCLTSQQRYVEELVSQWTHWQEANPYPLGINWASALEVAFRSLSWLWVKQLLAGCETLPKNFEAQLLAGLCQHGRYLERYHSKYFSPNTHLLGEAVALLFIGTLCPDFAEAERWQRWGWKVVLEESERQVRPDGIYFEQSLYYHVYALDLFLYARILAARKGFVIPEQFDNTVVRMLDFLSALSAGGAVEGFGDDDGGRVFNPRRNRLEHMTDPLCLGAVEYQRADWASHTRLTEEAIWLFGDNVLPILAERVPATTSGNRAFEAGGVYLISDPKPVPERMMIDAGPQGADTCGHGHADALSIRLSVNGRRCLVDSGTYCYISGGKDRSAFRGTAAHNTLKVDGQDQAVEIGPFSWSSIPTSKTRRWINSDSFDLFDGEHNGYERLPDPVIHRRIVLRVKGAFWLVRDVVTGREIHSMEIFWYLAPEFCANVEDGRVRASADALKGNGLVLLPAHPSIWQAEVSSSSVSAIYGVKQPAPVIRFHVATKLPAECAILLNACQPQTGSFNQITGNDAENVRAYKYTTGSETFLIFFSDAGGDWSCGPWSSDARFVYCKIEGGNLKRVALADGSFTKWQGKALVSHEHRVERSESVYSEAKAAEFPVTDDIAVAGKK
jgi:hypothetical protein